jgi:putative ABC transport system substrate-binding protein
MLHGGTVEVFGPLSSSFIQGLSEDGFVEGRNIVIEYHWAQGQSERLRFCGRI